jgi:hypothetical protein
MATYYGQVQTPADAIMLFEACRQGFLPRVQRRLSEEERRNIKPGLVFVWDEKEAGMTRWTDGKSWSPSRVAGNFLIYHETYPDMERKRDCHQRPLPLTRHIENGTPNCGRGSEYDQGDIPQEGNDTLYGLIKQSLSIKTSTGQHLHLIAYSARQDPNSLKPSNDPQLRHIILDKTLYLKLTVIKAPGPTLKRAYMRRSYAAHHQQMHGFPYQRGPLPHPLPPSPASELQVNRQVSMFSLNLPPLPHRLYYQTGPAHESSYPSHPPVLTVPYCVNT